MFFEDPNGNYYHGSHEDGTLSTLIGNTLEDVIKYLEHFTNEEHITTGNGGAVDLHYQGQGFAEKQFIEHLIAKHNLTDGNGAQIFSVRFLEKVIAYGKEHERGSKDGLAYFLFDLIPELEFNEVCGYFADECLTGDGIANKRDYWSKYRVPDGGKIA